MKPLENLLGGIASTRESVTRITALCFALALWAFSVTPVFGQFTYITNGGSILISGYTGSGGSVIIPSTANGMPVVGISDNAFYNKSTITSVYIPSSVISIGNSAFYNCNHLFGLYISSGVFLIGNLAFNGCSVLTSITIPSSVTSIGDYAFEYCNNLNSITIPNSVTSMGSSALNALPHLTNLTVPSDFTPWLPSSLTTVTVIQGISTSIGNFKNFSKLTSVTIGNGITSIASSAFQGCSGLTSVTIPNSVTSIGSGAFQGCSGLTSVTIPSTVTSIGSSAFQGCSGSILVDANNPVYSSGGVVLFNKSQTMLIQCPVGIAGSYTIPSSVTSIGSGAFQGCSGLTSVTVPSSVTSIPTACFNGCSSLTSITIPSSVTSIGSGNWINASQINGAFQNCTSLTSITIPSSVTSIGLAAFQGCSGLTSAIFQGNAPTPQDDNSVFSGDTLATAYYPAGKTGWTAMFDGIPTAMQGVAPTPPALGISTYSGGLPTVFFPTATGTNFVLQTTTNLTSGIWTSVGSGVPISGLIITNAAPSAFFRLQ